MVAGITLPTGLSLTAAPPEAKAALGIVVGAVLALWLIDKLAR
jgi:hypothetical protein